MRLLHPVGKGIDFSVKAEAGSLIERSCIDHLLSKRQAKELGHDRAKERLIYLF